MFSASFHLAANLTSKRNFDETRLETNSSLKAKIKLLPPATNCHQHRRRCCCRCCRRRCRRCRCRRCRCRCRRCRCRRCRHHCDLLILLKRHRMNERLNGI